MEEAQAPAPRPRVPCAACKMLRRRCDNTCVLSPYFPVEEIEKFAGVHKIFGASNVIRMVQTVEEANREDAVKALVYEATARLRDPVYGSAGTVFRLQKMVEELRSQLETASAQASELQAYRDHLQGIVMEASCLDNDPADSFDFDHFNHFFSQDGPFACNDYDHVSFPF